MLLRERRVVVESRGSGTLRPACLSLACPSRPRGPLCFGPFPYSLPVIMRLTSEGAEAKTHVPRLLLELTYNLFWCLRCREQKWNALIFGSFPSKSPSSVTWARCFCPLSHSTLHHPCHCVYCCMVCIYLSGPLPLNCKLREDGRMSAFIILLQCLAYSVYSTSNY